MPDTVHYFFSMARNFSHMLDLDKAWVHIWTIIFVIINKTKNDFKTRVPDPGGSQSGSRSDLQEKSGSSLKGSGSGSDPIKKPHRFGSAIMLKTSISKTEKKG